MPQQTDKALADLREAIVRAGRLLDDVLDRASLVAAERAEGRSYAQIVAAERGPLIVEMLTDVLEELSAAGAAFRRAEARALSGDGLSQEAIAALFGVSRQRVSALLKRAREEP